MKNKDIRLTIEQGIEIAHVPLGRDGIKTASIQKADYDDLLSLGITGNWCVAGTFKDYVVCNGFDSKGNKLLVARVLLDAGPGESVRYLDGNPLNLRRSNLEIVHSNLGSRRDRDFIKARRLPTHDRILTNA